MDYVVGSKAFDVLPVYIKKGAGSTLSISIDGVTYTDLNYIVTPGSPAVGKVLGWTANGPAWVTVEGGGGGGTSDYNRLSNKPSIGGNTLQGNKSPAQLGIVPATRTVNGKALNEDISLSATDVEAVSSNNLPDEILSSSTFTPKVGGFYQYTVAAGDTVTFNNPSSGSTFFKLDIIVPDPVVSFTWGQEIEWQGGVTPSFSASGTVKLQFEYVNGSWRGYCRPDMSQYVAKSGENFVDYTNFKITSRSYYDSVARTVIGFTSDGSALMLGDNVRTNYVSVFVYGNWIQNRCINYVIQASNNLYINANVQKIYLNNHIANTAGGFCISDATTGNLTVPGALLDKGDYVTIVTASSGIVTIPAESGHIYNYTAVAGDTIEFTDPTGTYAPEFELDIRQANPVVSFSLPIVNWKFGSAPSFTAADQITQIKFRYNTGAWATAYGSIARNVSSPVEGSLKYITGSVANTVTIQKYTSGAWENVPGLVDITSTVADPVEGSVKYTQGSNVVSIEKYTHWEGWVTPDMSEYATWSGGTFNAGMGLGITGRGSLYIGTQPVGWGNSWAMSGVLAVGRGCDVQTGNAAGAIINGDGLIIRGASGAIHGRYVGGRYNVAVNDYPFIIGGGTDNTHRVNIFTIDYSGNVVCTGAVTPAGDLVVPLTASSGAISVPAQSGVIYTYTLEGSEAITFVDPVTGYIPHYEIWLTQPATAVSFTWESTIAWDNGKGIYSPNNTPPDVSTGSTCYHLVFQYDSINSRWNGNLAATV